MALEHVSKSAMDCKNAVGKDVLQNLNYLAMYNTKQFEKVEMWAKMEELASGRLEKKVEEEKARNKEEMNSLRRDMVAWKDQAEKMYATRREAIQERRFFHAKAYRLEREALALGDEVRTALKKGKTLSSAELKSVRKLLKKTAKTAKSASSRDEPAETTVLPPETRPPPLPEPLPPSPPEQIGQACEAPQRPTGAEAPGPGPERRKVKSGGPLRQPPRGDWAAQAGDPSDSSSLSSSSSSDSDDTGDGTIESFLCYRRQERL